MQVSKRSAISTAVVAAVVVIAAVVVVAGVYVAYQPGAPTTTNVITNTTVTTSVDTIVTGTSVSTNTVTITATSSTPTYTPATLQAGGSSFANPVMQVWIAGFTDYTGGVVLTNYQAIGSGAGITGVLKGTFDFAGSDAPVSAAQSANYTAVKGPLLTIPETLGAVAIFYNIPGVTKSLNLTGQIIADIYLRHVTMWDNASILAINPKVNATLLAHPIIPVHRSDGSGTTYALTNYFTKVSTDWNASGNGFGTSVSWPAAGELAGKGSAGVAALVSGNPYAIGYADSYYAFSNKLTSAAVKNAAGNFEAPSIAGAAAAAAAFSAQIQADPTFTITNAPGANSYPISTFTYLLVWQNQTVQGKGNDIAQFFLWIVTHGQSYGPPLFYPSLPASVVTVDTALIAKMNFNGVSFTG